jgi:hypothetical protein
MTFGDSFFEAFITDLCEFLTTKQAVFDDSVSQKELEKMRDKLEKSIEVYMDHKIVKKGSEFFKLVDYVGQNDDL